MLGIISGSGLYNIGKMKEKSVPTPYGRALMYSARLGGDEVLFIPRHRQDHSVPAHMVNYKANLWAMEEEGATALLTFYAAGVISAYKPGDLVLLRDFIGLFGPATFYDSFESGIRHADMYEPYDRKLCDMVKEAASANKVKIKGRGIIATTRGPRFETAAEIKVLGKMGANLVNMTASYEVSLANELELPIASIGICTNYACGVKGGKHMLHEEVTAAVKKKEFDVNKIATLMAREVL